MNSKLMCPSAKENQYDALDWLLLTKTLSKLYSQRTINTQMSFVLLLVLGPIGLSGHYWIFMPICKSKNRKVVRSRLSGSKLCQNKKRQKNFHL